MAAKTKWLPEDIDHVRIPAILLTCLRGYPERFLTISMVFKPRGGNETRARFFGEPGDGASNAAN